MATYVQVANLAAIKTGTQARISAPDDDTVIARAVASTWDISRRAAIRDGDWNFASRRERLAALAVTVPDPFAFAYQMPAEAVRLIALIDGGSDYRLEGGRILCDFSPPLRIRYAIDVTEPAEWDDLFAEAFACKIALNIGERIAGSGFDATKVTREYQAALAAAKRVDAQENPRIEQDETPWVEARFLHGGATMPTGTWEPGGW